MIPSLDWRGSKSQNMLAVELQAQRRTLEVAVIQSVGRRREVEFVNARLGLDRTLARLPHTGLEKYQRREIAQPGNRLPCPRVDHTKSDVRDFSGWKLAGGTDGPHDDGGQSRRFARTGGGFELEALDHTRRIE